MQFLSLISLSMIFGPNCVKRNYSKPQKNNFLENHLVQELPPQIWLVLEDLKMINLGVWKEL